MTRLLLIHYFEVLLIKEINFGPYLLSHGILQKKVVVFFNDGVITENVLA